MVVVKQLLGSEKDIILKIISIEHGHDDGFEVREMRRAMVSRNLLHDQTEGDIAHHILQNISQILHKNAADFRIALGWLRNVKKIHFVRKKKRETLTGRSVGNGVGANGDVSVSFDLQFTKRKD